MGSHVSLLFFIQSLSLARFFLFRHITRGTEPGPSYHEKKSPPPLAVAFCVRTAAGSPVNNRFRCSPEMRVLDFLCLPQRGYPVPGRHGSWMWMGGDVASVSHTDVACTLLSGSYDTPYISVPLFPPPHCLGSIQIDPPLSHTKSSLETGCQFVWHFRKWQWVQGHFTQPSIFSGS